VRTQRVANRKALETGNEVRGRSFVFADLLDFIDGGDEFAEEPGAGLVALVPEGVHVSGICYETSVGSLCAPTVTICVQARSATRIEATMQMLGIAEDSASYIGSAAPEHQATQNGGLT
jgi:hypothetical protein